MAYIPIKSMDMNSENIHGFNEIRDYNPINESYRKAERHLQQLVSIASQPHVDTITIDAIAEDLLHILNQMVYLNGNHESLAKDNIIESLRVEKNAIIEREYKTKSDLCKIRDDLIVANKLNDTELSELREQDREQKQEILRLEGILKDSGDFHHEMLWED